MSTHYSVLGTLRAKRGQTIIELTLIFPLLLALVWGVIEVGLVIRAYLTITTVTREGANLTSRGTDPDVALAAIKASAAPLITDANQNQWKIIYSRIVHDGTPCQPSCTYVVEDSDDGQVIIGTLGESSRIGSKGDPLTTSQISGIEDIGPGQRFHSVEIFYDYTPNVLTYIGKNLLNKLLYEITIFTNVSDV